MSVANTMNIHPTAVVDPEAQIAPEVEIGPYVVIEGPVKIASGTKIWPHAYLTAPLEIGEECQIHVGAVLGHLHQALREPQAGGVRIGDRVIVREYASIHRASRAGAWTTIGSDTLLMGFSHVAHDCALGDRVIVANGTLLAGHVTVEDRATLSGHVAVHQFVRIGMLAMIGGLARVNKDVPPYFLVKGDSEVWSINGVGLRRAGLSEESRAKIREAYRLLYRAGLNTTQALKAIQAMKETTPELKHLVQFIQQSQRGICRHHLRVPEEANLLDMEGEDVV
ncbi:MAG: acyl-ACP--UDP-N-acetylglucosamine O-acyltransferase [Candidatus Omnitrophica bacterium]|nr:acyl-ACP--UDP-N-acetylglucosamine O-acyltransferase [Candidatus Omnitrophota bacterium]